MSFTFYLYYFTAIPHCAAEDTTLQGYTIPKGSLVVGNLWAVHHDPEVWNEPEVFRPSRFIDQDGHVTIKEEWTPFSIGRLIVLYRLCDNQQLHVYKFVFDVKISPINKYIYFIMINVTLIIMRHEF